MIFDVETSGLIPNNSEGVPLSNLPHILQISFVIFDTQYWGVEKSVNTYINVPQAVKILPMITELTGITREMCDKGDSIINALCEFQKEYARCDMIVAHNINFDRNMICIEMRRNKDELISLFDSNLVFNAEYEKSNSKEIYCTMNMGRNVCKIERMSKAGKPYYKSPKLSELYEYLFGMTPMDLHNSLVDTYICMRCLVKMRFKFDLSLKMFPNINFKPIKV
jgi:DNA polymerase-3 subunit epsilon